MHELTDHQQAAEPAQYSPQAQHLVFFQDGQR
jgi:hypothetical protein